MTGNSCAPALSAQRSAAICGLTPALLVLLGALGLSARPDYMLLPALVAFLGITAYALLRRHQKGKAHD